MAKAVLALAALIATSLPGFAIQVENAAQQLHFNGGIAELRGPWKFHLGDNSVWAAPSFDDASWRTLSADKPWGNQLSIDTYGFAWYRLRFSPGPSAPHDLAVLFPSVQNAYEVYWNGNLVGSYGKLSPRPRWYDFPFPETFGLGQKQNGVLAVRVWKASLFYSSGSFNFAPLLGSPDAIAEAKAACDFEWMRSRQFIFGLSSLLALISLIGLIGWLRDRRQWVLLWMALFAIVPVAGLFLLGLKILPDPVAVGIFQPIVAAGDVSVIFLLLWLLELKDDRRLVRIAIVLSSAELLAGFLEIFAWNGITAENPKPALMARSVLQSFFVLAELFTLCLIALALKRKHKLDHSRWMVAASCLLVIMVIMLFGGLTIASVLAHKDLIGIAWTPLFTLWGNPVAPLYLATPICLFTISYAVYRYTVGNRRRQVALEEEFRSAREIQSVMIPETLPSIPGIALTSAYKPMREVGGDFFQVLPLQSGSTLIVLGDVSGKGLKAAMGVSLIVGTLRAIVADIASPAELLAALGRSVHGQLQGGFATCIVLRVDSGGACVLANAGHPAPYLNGRDLASPGALPVGITPDAAYQETPLVLNPGDYLAIYSDGLLEARNRAGDLYGFDRLQVLLAARPSAGHAAEAAIAFGQEDDVTVLTLTCLPDAEPKVVEITGRAHLQQAH
jgi:hypothetical protein